MLGTLIAFDKNGSDLKTMMLCLCLVREKGANDSISRFNFTREMELFLTGATGLPATEPAGYTEATAYRNYYDKTKYMRAFGMMGLVHNPDSSYKDLALTKRGKAVLDCIDYTFGAAPPFIYSIIKQKKFTSLFVDNFVFGSFGKNNCGLEKSNTDIEYPKILIIFVRI